jgi:hypothetical protein
MPEFFPDQVHVGQDLGGREFAIPAEDVARYREGTANAAAGSDPAPPLLYHSEVYRRLDWYLANIIGNLHARQEWELFQPLRVGDVVRSHSTVVERYRKRNRDYVVNEVLFTDAAGRWLQRSRTHQSFLADDPGPEMVVDRERERRGDRRFALPRGAARTSRRRRRRSRTRCASRSRGRRRTTTRTSRWRGRSASRTSWSRGCSRCASSPT